MATKQSDETLYLAEQRRFLRLEVTLPVWLAREEDFDKTGSSPWSLGYTRDISMGGSKIYVPPSEELRWRDACQSGCLCLLRYDVPEVSTDEYVASRVKHVAREKESGNLWLGLEYDDGADEAKAAALKAGLKTVKSRRRWQGATVAALAAIVVAGVLIHGLRTKVTQLQWQKYQLVTARKQEMYRLRLLSAPQLASTRAEGIDASFQRKEVQQQLQKLTNDIQKLNDPKNQDQAEQQQANQFAALGISRSNIPVSGENVKMGIALPYGYAWSLVTDDLQQELGRQIPLVVTFQDFQSQFPLADCVLAQKLAKTMQITWEPWSFENPNAVSLQAITQGKYDNYIDSWANAARTFGSEVQIRWGHEMNGNWYPWSTSNNHQNPAIYVKAFQHIHDRFTRAGAYNVRWVWCINAETVPNVYWNNPLRTYPGDNYVDIISIDGYNFGSALPHSQWETFDQIFTIPYAMVVKAHPNKPLMINEVGCATVGGNKENWIRGMDHSLRHIFTRFTTVCWFEAQKEADWRMVSSPASLAAARAVWNQPYYRLGTS